MGPGNDNSGSKDANATAGVASTQNEYFGTSKSVMEMDAMQDDSFGNANVMDAAQHLAFLKNMTPSTPDKSMRNKKKKYSKKSAASSDNQQLIFNVPSLAASDVTNSKDDGSACSKPEEKDDAMLMAALAMTELCGTPSRPVPPKTSGMRYLSTPQIYRKPDELNGNGEKSEKRRMSEDDGVHGRHWERAHDHSIKRGRYESGQDHKFESPAKTKMNGYGKSPASSAITPTLAMEGDTLEKECKVDSGSQSPMGMPTAVPVLKRSIGLRKSFSLSLESETARYVHKR